MIRQAEAVHQNRETLQFTTFLFILESPLITFNILRKPYTRPTKRAKHL